MPTWSMMKLQDSNSPLMENLTMFHDNTMMILIMIAVMITYMLGAVMLNKMTSQFLMESQAVELIWTITPEVTLMFIALPSLRILYLMDELINPAMTVKAVGHQWYWSYEYSDFNNIEFDSNMKPTSELKKEEFRLLDVDNRMILPTNTTIRLLTTATDVIHEWTIPCLGIKMDAMPGRLNQMPMTIMRPTIMFGQCSEICGANHSFMPIVVEAINTKSLIEQSTLKSIV